MDTWSEGERNIEEDGTVFVVDDDSAVREGIADIVSEMGLQIYCFDSAEEFLQSYKYNVRQCLVLDVRMPGMNGLELLAKLTEQGIEIPVVMISGRGDIEMAVDAIKLGAFDFIEKPFREEKLWQSIREGLARSGERMSLRVKRKELAEAIPRLTRRERLVAKLLLEGNSDKETAIELEVSRRAIAFHRSAILEKLSFGSVVELGVTMTKLNIEL